MGSSCLWLAVALLAVRQIAVRCCNDPYYGLYCQDMCGANFTAASGYIRPPGYDSSNEEYFNSVVCVWNIVPQEENVSVIITFDHFSTETCCDYLYVSSDPSFASKNLVARYRGRKAYELIYEAPLYLKFRSDGSVTQRAFILRYQTISGKPPEFLLQAEDQTVTQGDHVLLPCNVTGIPPPVVTWYKDEIEIQSRSNFLSQFQLQGNNLVINNVTEDDAGYFKCRAQNYLNYTEQLVFLKVTALPTFVIQPTSVHFDSLLPAGYGQGSFSLYTDGLQATFLCQVYNGRITWKKDGKVVASTSSSLGWHTVKPVRMSDEGNYTCEASNIYGKVESRAASLTIGRSVLCCVYLHFQGSVKYITGTKVELFLSFQSSEYRLATASVTKDGYRYSLATYSNRSDQQHLRTTNVAISLGHLSELQTGVYGWKLYMTASALRTNILPNIVVSSFMPVILQGPPRVTLTPSVSLVRNYLYGKQTIACSVEPPSSSLSIRWFKNADQLLYGRSFRMESGYSKSYLLTFNEINTTHYTCSARNSAGMITNATVSVVVRGVLGGWSWWTEDSPCSVSCGPIPGFRIRTRRCYNATGCSGMGINITTCYSFRLCLPVKTTSASPTVETTTVETTSAAVETTSAAVKTTSAAVETTSAAVETTTDAAVATETPSFVSSSLPMSTQKIETPQTISDASNNIVITAVVCIIPTAIVTAVVTVAIIYCILKRKSSGCDDPPREDRQDVGRSGTTVSAHNRYDSAVTFSKKNKAKIERAEASHPETVTNSEENYERLQPVSGVRTLPARQARPFGNEMGYKHPRPQATYDQPSTIVRSFNESVSYVNTPIQRSSQTQQRYEKDGYVEPAACQPSRKH
ncbi:uncharacterized protein LOC134182020 isoform X3 [Corticium candelabrum]|uniref:uncharacterized protein LOC134182020 isoform X3 n=1 Tax=Corticium candelabrum TaxID=121492 RepID=UPI002E269AE7|nr:uncharacterized protein LOC134182020 isoform X3 [Corticium candelabrum]